MEAPVRVAAILKELEPLGICQRMDPKHFSEDHILAVHDPRFVAYLKRVCRLVEPGKSIYPYTFPIRNAARPPKELPMRAGYYCIDTFTPLNQNAYLAARRAVDCALTAAEALLGGFQLCLCPGAAAGAPRRAQGVRGVLLFQLGRGGGQLPERPRQGGGAGFGLSPRKRHPGHILSARGRVHRLHSRASQFRLSLFQRIPRGKGRGAGAGVQPESAFGRDGGRQGLSGRPGQGAQGVRRFQPRFLVVALGLDPAKGDPTGSWRLTAADFAANGRMVAGLKLPTLVVQEGGYRIASLGKNARGFFAGLPPAFGPYCPAP